MTFELSLRFSGGDFDPDYISEILELRPSMTSLDPKYRQTGNYWTKYIDGANSIEERIYEITDQLWPKRETLLVLRKTGVIPSLFVSIYLGERGNGFLLTNDIFYRMSYLSLDWEVDLYGSDNS